MMAQALTEKRRSEKERHAEEECSVGGSSSSSCWTSGCITSLIVLAQETEDHGVRGYGTEMMILWNTNNDYGDGWMER
jgi:hypothetical protein